jgi:hypothetical protein
MGLLEKHMAGKHRRDRKQRKARRLSKGKGY